MLPHSSRDTYQPKLPAFTNRSFVRRISHCYAIPVCNSVVMVDDLAKLPGDDDLEPKRRGLRRLRKAERTFLKQQQQQPQASATAGQPGGKKAVVAAAVGATTDDASLPQSADTRGTGRQWGRRCWRTSDLEDLARVVLTARTIVESVAPAGNSTNLKFSAVLEGLCTDAAKTAEPAEESGKSAVEAAAATSGGSRGGKGGKKGKGGGKGKEAAVNATAHGEEESEEAAMARKKKEEREAEVKGWSDGLRTALEGETFVTTAHRAAVAARDAIVRQLTNRTKVSGLLMAFSNVGV